MTGKNQVSIVTVTMAAERLSPATKLPTQGDFSTSLTSSDSFFFHSPGAAVVKLLLLK